MTSASELLAELAQVTSPTASGFSVRDIPSAPGYKIGRGIDGVVALLTPPDSQPEPPTRLRTLQIDPRVRVSIQADGLSTDADHGLVQLVVHDTDLLDPFLGVAATIIRLLGPRPNSGDVSSALRRLVKIFDPALQPRGSVLGLWAELLLVEGADDPGALVDAWHAHVDARFDFSAPGTRLEVKATTRDQRIHQFNLRQLVPVSGAEVIIASIMTTETHAGLAVGDLVDRLNQRLASDTARQVRVHQLVADTLGADWARHLGRRFDERQGEESLAFLYPADVPRVSSGPAEVIEVRLTVDCTGVVQHSPTAGLAALAGLRRTTGA